MIVRPRIGFIGKHWLHIWWWFPGGKDRTTRNYLEVQVVLFWFAFRFELRRRCGSD